MEVDEQIDMTVVVPESADLSLTPALVQPSPTQPGQGDLPGRLAFTGLEVTVILLLAVVLVVCGVVIRRLARRENN